MNTSAPIKKEKSARLPQFLIAFFSVILIVLIFCIMSLVGRIQGTARVVNYAGLVCGKTQRIIKLEATGLPNKNQCEELLDDPNALEEPTALCIFDMNDLRTINNTQGHDVGDLYIRSFAAELRRAIPEEYFVGRDGGDEFIAILKNVTQNQVETCLADVRAHMDEYSRAHSTMPIMPPISYAVGYALSTDFGGSHMRDLFRCADKNMYIDKNRSKLEEAANESRSKTDFMNRMNHDIRTPINGIMGMLDIIGRNRNDQVRVDDCLSKIRLSSEHLLALINDVLDMNKLQANQVDLETEPFDLLQLMTDVSSLIRAQLTETGLHHTSHRNDLVHTHLIGSPLKLRQIMLNLFSNSIKYNKPGGSIDTYSLELSCDGVMAVFEFKIADTGRGMSEPYVREELFKPFTQEKSDARTQYRGTGLGMFIVKQLIDLMGGSIQVESTLGEGTAFTFQLPFQVNNEAACTQAVHDTAVSNALTGLHILLVEDNDINMEIAEFYLTDMGAAVEKAWNGQEAVDKFSETVPHTFDAILMDVMMPVMDGLTATRCIRALSRPDACTVPILAMTAQVTPESLTECLDVGMNDRLSKPFEPGALTETLLKAVSPK